MLPSACFRRSLELLRDGEQDYAWELRDTQLGPYLALEGVPRRIDWTGQGGRHTLALLDFHVCYSHTYQVPVMCLRAAALDGEPLPGGVLAGLFSTWPRQQEQLLGFVTQQEHPLLPGPCWHMLHPCNTGTVLALALGLEADRARPAPPPAPPPPGAAPAPAAPAPARIGDAAGAAAADSPARPAALASLPGPAPGAAAAPAALRGQEEEDDGSTPDVDQFLLGLGAEQGAQGAAGAPVGPAGVAWPGGEVPMCPAGGPWLGRYMRAWFSLVGPHVGLLEGRARGPGAAAGGG